MPFSEIHDLSSSVTGDGEVLSYQRTAHIFRVTPMSDARKRIEQAGIDFQRRKQEEKDGATKPQKMEKKEPTLRDWLALPPLEPIEPDIEGRDPEEPRAPTVGEIKLEVAKRHGIPVRDLESNRRQRHIAYARFEAMWIARHLTRKSLPEIGRYFNRDHTTVLHAVGRYTKMLQTGEATYPPGWDHSITIDFKPLEYTEKRREGLQAVYDAFMDAYEQAHGYRVYVRALGNQWVAVEREGILLFKAQKPRLVELTEQYRSAV